MRPPNRAGSPAAPAEIPTSPFRRARKPLEPDSAAAARERALKLLGAKARGREELFRSLEERGFGREAAREALEKLEREGWLDDLAAARSAVRTRGARYGRARIQRELLSRGFAEETVAAALAELDAGEEEKTLARAFARLWKSHAGAPREARRRRVWNALVSRGFSAERVSAIMKGSDEVG